MTSHLEPSETTETNWYCCEIGKVVLASIVSLLVVATVTEFDDESIFFMVYCRPLIPRAVGSVTVIFAVVALAAMMWSSSASVVVAVIVFNCVAKEPATSKVEAGLVVSHQHIHQHNKYQSPQ